MNINNLVIREEVFQKDIEGVRLIAEGTGFFNEEEIDVAAELVEERLNKGIKSGYHFLFAEIDNTLIGYTSYGKIACTDASYDLYWIIVHKDYQGYKIGKKLLKESEEKIKNLGGKRIYVETSSREQYVPTRQFYLKQNYIEEAVLKDFYKEGDSKVIYLKTV